MNQKGTVPIQPRRSRHRHTMDRDLHRFRFTARNRARHPETEHRSRHRIRCGDNTVWRPGPEGTDWPGRDEARPVRMRVTGGAVPSGAGLDRPVRNWTDQDAGDERSRPRGPRHACLGIQSVRWGEPGHRWRGAAGGCAAGLACELSNPGRRQPGQRRPQGIGQDVLLAPDRAIQARRDP